MNDELNYSISEYQLRKLARLIAYLNTAAHSIEMMDILNDVHNNIISKLPSLKDDTITFNGTDKVQYYDGNNNQIEAPKPIFVSEYKNRVNQQIITEDRIVEVLEKELSSWSMPLSSVKGISGKYLHEIYTEKLHEIAQEILKGQEWEVVASGEVTRLHDETPDYVGYSDVLKIAGRYFRSWDSEEYSSGINEITEKEYKRLLKYPHKGRTEQ